MDKIRCEWCLKTEIEKAYHDEEWGTPLHDDRKLFEFLILDAFQAGLSWRTILNKRENFRRAFDNFEAEVIAGYGDDKRAELLSNPGIVRNRLKIMAAVTNAKAFLKIQEEYGSFDSFIWQFCGGKPIVHSFESIGQVPARSEESDNMSRELNSLGFKFVGSTICYAFMQAAGMINDHTVNCWKYEALTRSYPHTHS